MRISRKGALYFCGGIGSVGELKCGDGVITLAGEKFTVIAQNHEGYPENSTTLWSEVSTGSTYTVNKSYSTVANAAKSMAFSSGLTNIMLDTTVYYKTAHKKSSSYVTKQFAIGKKECSSSTGSLFTIPGQYTMSYLASASATKIRYHNGRAVNHSYRDIGYDSDGWVGANYITTSGGGYTEDGSKSGLYVFPVLNIPNTTKITGINSEGYYILAV